MENVPDSDVIKYPSVELAYDFVEPSYDWMITRFEAINTKLQGLLTLAASITAAIPIISKAIFYNISFGSLWFVGAIIAFIILVVMGIIAMRMGTITLLHPQVLYNKYLSFSHWKFKQVSLYWAGEHFNTNKNIIDKKALFRDIMTAVLLAEILCFIFWIVFK